MNNSSVPIRADYSSDWGYAVACREWGERFEREVAELREAAVEAHAALGKALHAVLDRRSVHHAYVRLGDALNPPPAQGTD